MDDWKLRGVIFIELYFEKDYDAFFLDKFDSFFIEIVLLFLSKPPSR